MLRTHLKSGGFDCKYTVLTFMAAAAIALMLIFPHDTTQGALYGLSLWAEKVVPSLFPFMFISTLMYHTDLSSQLALIIRRTLKPFIELSIFSIYIVLMSFLSGYPMAARLLSLYWKDNQIEVKDCAKLLILCSVAGPIFISGTIGAGFLNHPRAALVIAVSHYASAIITGIISSKLYDLKRKKTDKVRTPFTVPLKPANQLAPLSALPKAILNSCQTMLLIGGFITVFSVLLSLIEASGIFQAILSSLNSPCLALLLKPCIYGILEMANGCYAVSQSTVGLEGKIILMSFFISWGGFSIHCQTLGLLSDVPISSSRYLFYKLLHGLIAVCIAILISPFLL